MHNFGKINRRDVTLALLASGAASPLTFGAARAAGYPEHQIKLIVPVPPGSGTDAVARALGQQMGDQMGVPVINEYRPGASAVVGSEALVKSPADGYTIMLGYTSHATNPLFNAHVPYDTLKDFTPIVYVCYIPTILVVHPSNPANTVQELVKMIKDKPGKWTYASGGVGAGAHLAGELLKQTAGLDIQHVPYKGNAPALNDMLGGHNTLMFDIVSTSLPLVQAGKLKALAIADAKRSKEAPQVPTMIESGFPGFVVVGWYVLLAPPNLPKDILARLNSEADKALKAPAVHDKLSALGFEIVGGSPQQADTFIRSEMKKWGDVVAKAGLKAQ